MAKSGCVTGIVVTALLIFAGYEYHRVDQEKRAKEQAELQAGIDASSVLSATFGREASLRVATLTGRVKSRGACLSANFLTNSQVTIAPYSVAYSVDLGRVGPDSYRWNARDHVMFVDLPGITAETPAIDIASARTVQSGIFVSRACGVAMQQQVAGLLTAAAADKSVGPAYLAQARDAARAAIERLTQAPLSARGLGTVAVRVRFATDPRPQDDRQWDVSRSIAEVLADTKVRP